MYTVCTVRIRPVRAEGLCFTRGGEVTNPLVVAQIYPWEKNRRTTVLYGGGSDPRWMNTDDPNDNMKHFIDLPYYGHPYSGESPSITLVVLNVENASEDLNQEFSGLTPQLIGKASFDLRPYLSENKNMMHGLTLRLADQNQNYVGKIICTLQFVLTGIVRLTVLSGQRLRSNVQDNEDVEPFVEARLTPGKNKWRRTIHKQGENPEWGEFTRKTTLSNFNLTRLNIFSSRKSIDVASQTGASGVNNGRSNILEFKFKDEDRSLIPVVHLNVKDKMNTIAKIDKRRAEERSRVAKLEKEIKQLRRKSKSSGARIATAMSANVDGSPRILSKGFAGMFKKTLPRKPGQRTTRRRKQVVEEVDLNSPPVIEETLDEPLNENEAELMRRLRQASHRLKKIDEGAVVEDRLIGSGSIDLRPLLKYDGKHRIETLTVDLLDDNGLASGSLVCSVEFDNAAYDPSQEVLHIPELSFNLGNIKYRDLGKRLRNLRLRDAKLFAKNVYILTDVALDMYAPRFVVTTSNQTGMPKVAVFVLFFSVTFLFLLSLWKGLGNEFISYVVGVLYPTYQSFKALENKNSDKNNQWLTYWIIYGMFNFLEKTVLLPFIFVYPTIFFLLKTVLFLWLTNPQTLGASLIYYMIIAPLMRSYEDDIDAYISVFGKTTHNFVMDFAGYYDQFEQEMTFAVAKNLVDKKGYFANNNRQTTIHRKKSLNAQVQAFMDNSSVSELQDTTLKVMVVAENGGRGKVIAIDIDDKLEDVLLHACGKMGITNFNDYKLFYYLGGDAVELEDIQQLEVINKPRILVKQKEIISRNRLQSF